MRPSRQRIHKQNKLYWMRSSLADEKLFAFGAPEDYTSRTSALPKEGERIEEYVLGAFPCNCQKQLIDNRFANCHMRLQAF